MKTKFCSLFFVLLFQLAALWPTSVWCQEERWITPEVDLLLEKAGLELFEPLDAGYRVVAPIENNHLNSHLAIYSRQEKLEIRYFILPWNESDPNSTAPHVATFRALTAIASNAEDAVISAIKLEGEQLGEGFNADWGMVYFFQPKLDFSMAKNCKMLAVSKMGKGTAFVFFLFDEPSNTALDNRAFALRFNAQ